MGLDNELIKFAAAVVFCRRHRHGQRKFAGAIPGVPDRTGPYGRGLGLGRGTQSGLGALLYKIQRGEELTDEERALLEQLLKGGK